MSEEVRYTGRSIIIPTPYGRIILFVVAGKLQIRLQRRIGPFWRFVRPTPQLLQLVCSKHVEETKGEGKGESSIVEEAEMIVVGEIEQGLQASLQEVYDFIESFKQQCLTCMLCEMVRWETINCTNMCHADWEVVGLEFRPVPPAKEAECIMVGYRKHGGAFTCECESLRIE